MKNELTIGFATLDLYTLEAELEKIAGEWNGDESGEQERRASIALEAIDIIRQLQDLLKQL